MEALIKVKKPKFGKIAYCKNSKNRHRKKLRADFLEKTFCYTLIQATRLQEEAHEDELAQNA